jgi:hypothetical protein
MHTFIHTQSLRNVPLNLPHKLLPLEQHQPFAIVSQLQLRLRKTINPVLIDTPLHPLQHPQLIHASRRVVLDDLLTVLELLFVHVQVQLAQVTLYYVHLTRLVYPPSLVKSVVRFPHAYCFLVLH